VCSPLRTAAATVAIFALNVLLHAPLFAPGEMPYRDSIEGGYAGMSRFFADNPNPWGWNPTQYMGLPAQFTYLPAMPYGAALLHYAAGFPPDYAYRVLTAALACAGPASLFAFVLYFTRSRRWAVAVALAYTLFSPLYGLIHTIALDQGVAYLPWRVQVLVKYGEGPHNAALMLLPLALIAAWRASTTRGFRALFIAAIAMAAVTLTNWVGALALACCCLLMLLTLAGSAAETGFRASRLFAAAALGYGLACFWLTPSFIGVIALNWPVDAFNYELQLTQKLLLGAAIAIPVALRLILGRAFPRERYLWFAVLCAALFSWIVLWFYQRGYNTIPESRRYALEMELFLWAAFFELMRVAMRVQIVPRTLFASAAVLAIVVTGWGQLRAATTQGFTRRWPVPRESTIEYRAARRLAELGTEGRVAVSGGTRFRLNSWFPIAQPGGGFESGLGNRLPVNLLYQIRTGIYSAPGREAQDAIRELAIMGAEYVLVHGTRSREHYRDFQNPKKFDGVLDPVWREEDDVIYRTPVRSIAHLVKPAELTKWFQEGLLPAADPYPGAVTDLSRPRLWLTWRGASELHIRGPIPEGHVISVQMNYHPGWSATQDGRPIPVENDYVLLTVLRPRPAAETKIVLRYRAPDELRWFSLISAIVWLGSAAAAVKNVRRS
jgi:hypothetical protein